MVTPNEAQDTPEGEAPPTLATPIVNGNSSPTHKMSSPKMPHANNVTATNNGNKNVEELYDIPVGK